MKCSFRRLFSISNKDHITNKKNQKTNRMRIRKFEDLLKENEMERLRIKIWRFLQNYTYGNNADEKKMSLTV